KHPDMNVSQKTHDYSSDQPVIAWNMKGLARKPFCLRVFPETTAFSADKVIDGYSRPYGGPHQWVSERMVKGREEWLELSWAKLTRIEEIQITFNNDVNQNLNNLHRYRTDFEIFPELAKDYRI